jgi:nicotinamide mononucleotide adenylyltransferase
VEAQLTDEQLKEAMRIALEEGDIESADEIGNTLLDREDSAPVEQAPTAKKREPMGILTSPTKFTEGLAEGYKKGIPAAAELALSGITAGALELGSGIAGLTAYALSGGDMDYAADRTRKWQEKMYQPRGEDAQTIIETIAPPLSRADTKITNFAEQKAGGDPLKATAIKTMIYGGADALAAIFPLAKPIKDVAKLKGLQRQIMQDARRLGINLDADDFTNDVIRASKEFGSTQRGAASEEYVQALRRAEYLARLKKNSKYLEAYNTDLKVNTSMMRNLGKELVDENNPDSLAFKYDLTGKDMKRVRETLNSMKHGYFSGKNKIALFKRVESFRQQLRKKINSAKSSEKAALIQIKAALDDRLNVEFNKAMMNQGDSALTGSPESFNVFNEARQLAKEHAWFNDNKVISDLIRQDTTAEQFSTWLIGASSSGAKKQAGAVVKKIKQLLGDDHPAIEAIRTDFTYELMAPLFKEKPNFQQFINNYDLMLRNNHSLVKELGLLDTDITTLEKFAKTARYLPEGGNFYSIEELTKAFSQIAVGHGVAKGAARVKFMTKVLKLLTGQSALTEKEILRSLTNSYLDEPIILSNSPAAAGVMAAATVSGIVDEN